MTQFVPITSLRSAQSNPAFSYIPSFDGIRAYAVGLVMLFHSGHSLLRGGWIGVDLFFALSGYLITSLLLHELATTGTIALTNFYIRRGLRLVPPLLLCVGLSNILWPYTREHVEENQLVATLASLFYVANLIADPVLGSLRHLWSLATEEQFYFLWPPVLMGFLWPRSHRQQKRYLVGVIVLISIFRIYVFHSAPVLAGRFLALDFYRFTFCRLDTILLGALLAITLKGKRGNQFIQSHATLCFVVLSCLFGAVLLRVSPAGHYMGNGGFIITNALCLFTVFVAIQFPHHPLLSNSVVRWVGRRSYGLYIYHFPIFLAMNALFPSHSTTSLLLGVSLRLALTGFAAELSFRLVEGPVLKLKRKYPAAPLAAPNVVQILN